VTAPAWLPWLGYALELVVAALAVVVARAGRPYHRPFVRLAVFLALVDPARAGLSVVRDHLGRVHPLGGVARVAYELDRASDFAGPLAIGLAAWVIFAGWRWGHLVGAAVLAEVAVVAMYPGSRAKWVAPAIKGAALLIGWSGVAIWLRARAWATNTQHLVVLYLAVESCALAVVTATGQPRETWPLVWIGLLALQLAAVVAHVHWMRAKIAV
jgi:hypothetical protein